MKEWSNRRNAAILAEHADLRAEILALRPAWSAEKLETIQHTYGSSDGSPGLRVILDAVTAADALEAKFGGGK